MATLPTIDVLKEQEATHSPRLLCVITWPDSTVLRLATHPGTYGGNVYEERIVSQEISAVQAIGATGFAVVPTVTLQIADPDTEIFRTFEQAKGFEGAQMDLTFVFYDVDAELWSSDEITKFRGICGAIHSDGRHLTLQAKNRLDLSRKWLPVVVIQRRCPWIFPPAAANHQAAADNRDSRYYRCGYSPTATGGEARGTGAFTDCQYTIADCKARGMYIQDGSARVTGRYGGIQWIAPAGIRSKEYVSGDWLDFKNTPNEAKYSDYFPLAYGTAWVDCKVMSPFAEGNSTRGEAVISEGEIEYIEQVTVNGINLPRANSMDGGQQFIVPDALMRYNVVNRGDRTGAPNADIPWNGKGDPYGSLASILWVVHRKVADDSSNPRVRALVQGNRIRSYTNPSTFTHAFTAAPPWVLMDLLVKVGFTYDELDIDSFVAAAAICNTSIQYEDQNGATATHARFSTSLVLAQRRSAAEVLQGFLRSFRGIVAPNNATGKLEAHVQQTLADQQGSAVPGSNDNTPVSSITAAGGAQNGYVAYHFNDATIRRRDGETTVKIKRESPGSVPNVVAIKFANEERDHAIDLARLVDADSINRRGEEVPQTVQVDGVPNLDQAKRIANVLLAEGLRGNSRGDTGGTVWGELEPVAGFRALRLRVGHICKLTEAQHGIADQLIRIAKIKPGSDFESCVITFRFHNDAWYTDSFGQTGDPGYSDQARDRLPRPSWAWSPGQVSPAVGDPMFRVTDQTFALQQLYDTAADGTALAQLIITGIQTVNEFAQVRPPRVLRQGTTAATGGSLEGDGREYFLAVCPRDSGGLLGPPSVIASVAVVAPGNTNTVTITCQSWDPDSTGYYLFAGRSPNLLTYQAQAVSKPGTITLSAFNERAWGIPDGEFDKYIVQVKRIAHSGVWARGLTAVSTNTLTVAGAGWTTNEWAGRDCSIIAAQSGTLGVFNFRVTSNTGEVLTVTPNPFTLGVAVNDVLTMRALPTVGADYLEDAKWINPLAGAGTGLAPNAEVGLLLRIISGPGATDLPYRIKSNTTTRHTIEGAWITTPTSDSRYIIESAEWKPAHESDSLSNPNHAAEISLAADVANYAGKTVLVGVATEDGGGNRSLPPGPIREIYVAGKNFFGAPGTPTVDPLQSLILTPSGSWPAGWTTNPFYTLAEGGIETVGASLRITPPNDTKFNGTSMYVDQGDGVLVDVGFHVYQGTVPAPYDVVIWRAQPPAAQTWKFVGASASQNAFNAPDPADPNQTVSTAITASSGIPPEPPGFPSAVTVQVLGDLWENTQTPASKLTFEYTAPVAGVFSGVTLFLKKPGDSSFIGIAFYEHTAGADGTQVTFIVYQDRPTADETWEAVLSPTSNMLRESGDSNYISFLVQKTGTASATGISDGAVGAIAYTKEQDGQWFWGIPAGITWTNPTSDQNFFFSRLTVQIVDSAGNPQPGDYGTDRTVYEQQWSGFAVNADNIDRWGVLAASEQYRVYRFKLWSVDWDRTATLQTDAWGAGVSFIDVEPAEQTGSLKLDRTDPATRGDGLEVVSGQMKLKIQNGLEFSSGSVQVKILNVGLAFSEGNLYVKTNGTEIGTDGSGQLQVNGVPAPKVLAGQLVVGVTIVGQQIISGSISASVAYLGQVNATQVNAGLFSGHSLELSQGGVTTSIRNLFETGDYIGLKISDGTQIFRASKQRITLWNGASEVINIRHLAGTGGLISVNTTSGVSQVSLTASSFAGGVLTVLASGSQGGYADVSREYRIAGLTVIDSARNAVNLTNVSFGGQFRIGNFVSSGSPALPASYKFPVYTTTGTFLGSVYIFP